MKINILIVDDSKSILLYAKGLLEEIDKSYNITIAGSGKEALEIIATKEIDLIILDIQMPDMDGFEIAGLLKSDKNTADIPIVFLTASTNLKTEGLELGAVDYLTKPIDEDQFKSRISLYTRLVKSIKENRLKDQHIQQQSRLAQMGEMISMIAHQWRQPLGAIAATSIDLKLKSEFGFFNLEEKEEAKKYETYINNGLDKIDDYVQNLTTTIDDFRNFYKPNKGSVSITLQELVKKSINVIEMSLVNDNIEIIQEHKTNEAIELYDSEMMQVILNLLKNSQDNFIEKKIQNAKIKITTENKTISICDNGSGISADIIDKIFDPYFSTKDEKNGTGLGLYMSKTIIEDHHAGKLTVSNQDGGVCFLIELGAIQPSILK